MRFLLFFVLRWGPANKLRLRLPQELGDRAFWITAVSPPLILWLCDFLGRARALKVIYSWNIRPKHILVTWLL